jgi:hypothetical protein
MATSALEFGNWQPALFRPHRRSIGGIIAAVTIQEHHDDDLQITEHPVEQGAPITDHAFKRPASVTIRAGWSVADSFDLSAETGVYGLLLSWQAALLPFDVITGKRSYAHMLIERLSVTTDNHSEWALIADITCKQIIIVATSTTQVAGMSSNPGSHADPSATAPASDQGNKQSQYLGNDPTYDERLTAASAPTFDERLVQPPPATPQLPFGAEDTPSTPQAAAVSGQMISNGAAPPNVPATSSFFSTIGVGP